MTEKKTFVLWNAVTEQKITVEATRQSGDEWKALCPSHDDHNPSLSINEYKRVYNCPVCNFTGKLYDPNFKEGEDYSKEPLLPVNPLSEELTGWLKDNGKMTPKAFEHFGVGEGSYYDEPCMIIPVSCFQRIYLYKREDKADRWRSYPRGSGVLKGDLSKNPIIVAEGEWDLFCLWENKYKNVATSTTGAGNFPDNMISLLKGKDVILAYDNQPSVSIAAFERMSEKLSGIANSVRMIDWQGTGLKHKEDVRDFYRLNRKGRRGLHRLLKKAKSLVELAIEKIDPSVTGLELNMSLKPILKKIALLSPSEQDAHFKIIKKRFGLTGEDIKGYKQELKPIVKETAQSFQEELSEPVFSAMFSGLVDIVEHEGQPAFLIMDDGELKVELEYEVDGVIHVPPPKESLKWLLPRSTEVLKYYEEDDVSMLYQDLLAYHKSISELPSKDYYHLLALWDFHTYLYDKSEFSPYLWFYAIPERGKTRTGKGCIYVAHRGLHIESLREPNILRYAEHLGATLFFDVMDIWKKAERNDCQDILLHRFERGATISRVLHPDRGPHKDMKHFKIYGPTIAATNIQVHKILETRAIQIIMRESNTRFEDDVKPEMGLPYKERLTAFRAKHMDGDLPPAKKPTSGRLGAMLRPLRQIGHLVCPQEEERFMNMVRIIEGERKSSLQETTEARIVELLFGLEKEFKNGLLEVKKLADAINEGLQERFQKSQKYYTQKLKSMGLQTTRSGGKTYIIWDEVMCNKLAQRYLGKTAPSAQSARDGGDGSADRAHSAVSEGVSEEKKQTKKQPKRIDREKLRRAEERRKQR